MQNWIRMTERIIENKSKFIYIYIYIYIKSYIIHTHTHIYIYIYIYITISTTLAMLINKNQMMQFVNKKYILQIDTWGKN